MIRKFFRRLSQVFDPAVFVLEIRGGRARLVAGKAPGAFVREVTEFASDTGLERGSIRGKEMKGYVRLLFSREIPESMHQRLRNIWHLHAPSPGRGKEQGGGRVA